MPAASPSGDRHRGRHDARPATAPTLRSIWAAPITKVIATAMTEIVAVCAEDVEQVVR